MQILFVHQNFPGPYLHLARHLVRDSANQVVTITQRHMTPVRGLRRIRYVPTPSRGARTAGHRYLGTLEQGLANAEAVANVAADLKADGLVPDLVLGHNGWGEIWFLKHVFPSTPLLGYFEFFYGHEVAAGGSDRDVGTPPPDEGPRLQIKNAGNLLGLQEADLGQCPTHWQRSLYPSQWQSKLQVLHDGIDTELAVPDAQAGITLNDADGRPPVVLRAGDEVVTFVTRDLAAYGGFHRFMNALPTVLERRPNARVLIVGGDGASYRSEIPEACSLKATMLKKLEGSIGLERVHFLGLLPHSKYLRVLQVSMVHVYLTCPFGLSGSMLEAMSAGCIVVGSDTPPVREVIRNGANGLLFDSHSSEALARRILEVLEKPRVFGALRANARRTIVDRYDMRTVCLPAQMSVIRQWGGSSIDGRAGRAAPARRADAAQWEGSHFGLAG